ncbi:MAG: S9 family peptidase [Gemmatimonadaceae bacterium]|nr:S9 family peptidase [Gemmatimonadaceae bacterium]
MLRRLAFLPALAALAAAALPAQHAPTPDYSRAEQFLTWNVARLITGDEVNPQWYKDGTRFWYRNKTRGGSEFIAVDPARGSRAPLFDHARLAAALSLAADTAYDPAKLPFRTFRFAKDGDDESTIEFRAGRRQAACVITTYTCTLRDTTASEVPYVLSPDRKWEAFVRNHNVYVRPRGGGAAGDTVQLTTDGVEYWSYGLNMPRPMELFRPQPRRPQLRWAPDSRRLIVTRQDERNVARMPYISYTSQRPRLFTQPYALPGDSVIPVPAAYVIDRETKASVRIALPMVPASLSIGGALRDSVWGEGSTTVHLLGTARASKAAWLLEADATTGQVSVLATDSGKTFVETSNQRDPVSWYTTRDGRHAFWWSERDGWGHLWRFTRGAVPVQVTRGAWQVGALVHVDETARQLYFTARGREKTRFVYDALLYRVGFEGGEPVLLTPEPGNHDVVFAPSGRVFVDRISSIGAAPVALLRDGATGRVLLTLEKADVSQLAATGWKPAQLIEAKARDGVTDLYGVMYLPSRMDSTKRYPIISNIYPGPQVGSVGNWSFKGGGEPQAIAELGFIVVQIDHLGTPLRSKAFHDNYYANFGDNGIADHVAVIKQLAARHRFIDLDRVGIFGHSGGGFASTGAMFRFPDFFKVAVSGAGNHDNRSYNIYWAEKYQGLLRRDTVRKADNFTDHANATLAGNLRGKLLLMHGDMDDNVHPAMTIQVVDALIKANKSFDLVIAPNRAHSLNEPYFIRRRWDYFVQHLLGAIPPENYAIAPPPGGTGAGTVPAEDP